MAGRFGDVEAVGFPVQNVYTVTYGNENATFEPVNGYEKGTSGKYSLLGATTDIG
jgi:hypothetical protein